MAGEGGPMVMSQDMIDSMMAQAKSGSVSAQPAGDAPAPEEDDPETAAVLEELDAETADVDPLAVAEQTPVEEDVDPLAGPPPVVAAGPQVSTVKVSTYSASATSETEQLNDRMIDLEDKLGLIEASVFGGEGGGGDAEALAEIRASVEQLSATVGQVWAYLQELTQQSRDSLGFAAKQTFDCPECSSHGTIAVPVSCTSCGHEAEWGFWPEQGAEAEEEEDAA